MQDTVTVSKKMIEELNRSLKHKIIQEVQKQTIELRKSPFDEEADKNSGVSK